MKFAQTYNYQTHRQTQFDFDNQNHHDKMIKFLMISFAVLMIILSFPNFVRGQERLAIQSQEKTAILKLEEKATSTDHLIINIGLNPGQSINAVWSSLEFATTSLFVEKINLENSFCDLFIMNSFDNINGTIDIMCGKPFPGISTSSTVAEITFKKLKKQTSALSFSDNSLVLANDGYGTNVLLRTEGLLSTY